MELKTNQIKKQIKIFIYAELLGSGVDVKEIEEAILNSPFDLIVFNVNEIF